VNFMLYTPLPPGAAAGTLGPRHVVVPLRKHLDSTDLIHGHVAGADRARDCRASRSTPISSRVITRCRRSCAAPADWWSRSHRVSLFDDVAKTSVIRIAWPQAHELRTHQATAVALTPGWLRSELMLEHHGASEQNAARDRAHPALLHLRDQQMPRPGRRRACRRSRRVALERTVAVERPARAGLRLR
jgi:hypothetical protein